MKIHWIKLARAGYEAYGTKTGYKNFRGEPMPFFDGLDGETVEAWIAAAQAVCRTFTTAEVQQIVQSGYAGVLPGSGMIVDCRLHEDAIPMQQNESLNIPKSQL